MTWLLVNFSSLLRTYPVIILRPKDGPTFGRDIEDDLVEVNNKNISPQI